MALPTITGATAAGRVLGRVARSQGLIFGVLEESKFFLISDGNRMIRGSGF
jgi:hypothetical protein